MPAESLLVLRMALLEAPEGPKAVSAVLQGVLHSPHESFQALAVPVLLSAMAHAGGELTRMGAAKTLGQLGRLAAQAGAVAAVLHALPTEPKPQVRATMIRALGVLARHDGGGGRQDEVLATVVGAVHDDPDGAVQEAGVAAMYFLASGASRSPSSAALATAAVAHMVRLMREHPEASVRKNVGRVLAKLPTLIDQAGARSALIQALRCRASDSPMSLRAYSALVLGRLPPQEESTAELLRSLQEDPAPEVRRKAARAIGHVAATATGEAASRALLTSLLELYDTAYSRTTLRRGEKQSMAFDDDVSLLRDLIYPLSRFSKAEHVAEVVPRLLKPLQAGDMDELSRLALMYLRRIIRRHSSGARLMSREAQREAARCFIDVVRGGEPDLRADALLGLEDIGAAAVEVGAVSACAEVLVSGRRRYVRGAAEALKRLGRHGGAREAVDALTRVVATDRGVHDAFYIVAALAGLYPWLGEEERAKVITSLLWCAENTDAAGSDRR